MTAGREEGTAGSLGRLRTSQAEREQAVDVLKAAFIQGRLTKDEFDLRVGQVFASRTYAELGALTADIPDWVTSVQLPAEHAPEPGPGRMVSFKTAARVGAVGASPSVGSAAIVVMQSSSISPVDRLTYAARTRIVRVSRSKSPRRSAVASPQRRLAKVASSTRA